MKRRGKRLNRIIGLLIAMAIAVPTLVTAAHAATPAAKSQKVRSQKQPAAVVQRCKTRNKAHGTIRYSDWQFPDTLNPYQTSAAVSSETIDNQQPGVYLFQLNQNAKLIPYAATSVPTVKNGGIRDGGKTFVVHLKKGILWHNGQEVTSADIKFGWRVDMDQLTGPLCSGSCDVISRIDAPDRYTAVYHLKHTFAPFLTNAVPDVWPAKWPGGWSNDPHAAAQKLAQDATFTFEGPNYPTTGPYQVTEFVKDDRITLTPNPKYDIANCGASIAKLIFAFYSAKESMIAAASSRGTDITQDYTVADIAELKKHTGNYKLIANPGFYFEHLELNHDPKYNNAPNPLSNVKVRQALALALNKYGMLQSALGVSKKQATQIIAWTFLVNTPALVQPFANKSLTGQWDPIAKQYIATTGTGKALADAKKLLSQTPFKDGFSLDFYTTSGNAVRQAQESVIAQSWSKLNVSVKPNYVPASKLVGDWDKDGILSHGAFQIAMFSYLGGPDPDSFKYNMQTKYIDREQVVHASINGNDSGIHDAIINRDYTKAAQTLSKSARQRYYSEIQVQINKNAHWIPLYYRPVIATTSGRVTPFSDNPTATGPEWNSYAWRMAKGG